MKKPPDNLKDCREANQIAEDLRCANEYAKPGTVKHFLLRQGFYADNEEVAEAILKRIIMEKEWYDMQERTINYLDYLADTPS